MELIVSDLNRHLKNLTTTGTTVTGKRDVVNIDESIPQPSVEKQPDWSAIKFTRSDFGSVRPLKKTSSGISYGQPQFFSPVYTPINWQIPSRRREIYMWQVVEGQLLRDDLTYVDVEDLVLGENTNEIRDTITGGVLYENSEIGMFFSGKGNLTLFNRMSVRDCKNKTCFEFQPLGSWRSFSVSEEHGVYVLDGKLLNKKRKHDGEEKYKQRNIVSKTVFPDSFIVRKEAKDVDKRDFLLTPVLDVSKNCEIDFDWAYLIGLVSADGCISNTEKVPYIHFTVHVNDEKFVCESVNKVGLVPTSQPHHRSEKARRVYVRGKGNGDVAYNFVSKYVTGKLCCKKFTNEIRKLGIESLKNIIAGYLDGDGYFSGKNIVANMVSKDMGDQLLHICHSCGIRASLIRHPFYNNPYNSKNEWVYRLLIPMTDIPVIAKYMRSGKIPQNLPIPHRRDLRFFYKNNDGVLYLASPIRKKEKFEYTGKGYDFQVDPDRSYVLSGCCASNCRFWYENEPRVATCIDFYSRFPITGFETECDNRYVKHYFDQLNKKLNLDKWLRIISHEVHLLGDCFPFLEIDCPVCGGAGRVGDQICDHEGGSFKRILIMNPDFIEVFTNPISPDEVITYLPDEEMRDMVLKNGPGTAKLSMDVRKMMAEGRPIPLDSSCVSHIKYGESGYKRYGVSMIRRLFPILSYKTKIMTAQWIVAERLIIPIKVVKVGTEERPASEADIAAVQSQLLASSNDPNVCIVTHHAFDLEWYGASGKILAVSQEYEFINQEIMDGFGLNKQLITGEGQAYSSAGMGAEIMIRRLDSWRLEVKRWVEEKIYLPVAKMMGFVEKNEWGQQEYIYPKLKWDSLNLRDRQGERQMMLQLYDKGLISARRVLDEFEIDADTEFEAMRWERIDAMSQQPPGQAAGGAGGAGGGIGDIGGGLSMGGAGSPPGLEGGGGGMEGGPPGMEGAPPGAEGGAGAGAPPPLGAAYHSTTIKTAQTDPGQYGGKILTPETREKIDRERERLMKKQKHQHPEKYSPQGGSQDDQSGFMRDSRGRIMMTSIEREVMQGIEQYQRTGQIKYNCYSSYNVYLGSRPVLIDLAFPDIKVGVECDGEMFHGSPDSKEKDKARDRKLNNLGWVIVRFSEDEIKNQIGNVMHKIVDVINKREAWILEERKKLKEKSKNDKIGK